MRTFFNPLLSLCMYYQQKKIGLTGFLAFVLLSMVLGSSVSALAQTSVMGMQPNAQVNLMVEAHKKANAKKHTTAGFRVQIIQDSSRDEIRQQKGVLLKKFPAMRAYELYEQPYFKLRVGDFTNRFDAYVALTNLKTAFPLAFIVADKVNISEL